MDYQGFCTALIGTNGTSKTHTSLKILGNYLNMPKGEVIKGYYSTLVLVSDDSEDFLKSIDEIRYPEQKEVLKDFNGIAKLEVDDGKIDEIFKELFYNFHGYSNDYPNAIFIDDAMAILGTRNEWVMNFFKKRRQHRCNIILNCHGASEFPRSLFKNVTDFYIFQTLDSLNEIEARMSGDLVKVFREAVYYVNEVASVGRKYDEGNYKFLLRYFHFKFSMINPPTIENINELRRSKWWENDSYIKKYLNK